MKTKITPKIRYIKTFVTLCLFFVASISHSQQEPIDYTEYKGTVIDSDGNSLSFVNLSIEDTNITTVTNTDGDFSLKVPKNINSNRVIISYLGFNTTYINLAEFTSERKTIQLKEISTQLNEISLGTRGSARNIVKESLKRKAENYLNEQTLMTAFYRETIKKRRRNVSLAEAVVNINKQPYSSFRPDKVSLYKARKSTDYSRIDTVALKLQGGPLNTLYTDMMKYPEYFLTDVEFKNYNFSFDQPTEVDGKQTYVVNFEQRENIAGPLFYGKLYIDSETLALTDAIYSLNVEDKEAASALFVRKKPTDAFVYPTMANYRVNYRMKDGKWHYSYSYVQLEFVIDWDNRLFNSKYSLSSEMAITDLENNATSTTKSNNFRYSKVLVDETRGFADPEFWGEYNVIEPDKSIESAIKKIRKKISKG